MPVFASNTVKMLVLDEEKKEGIAIEFPQGVQLEILLAKIDEFRTAIIKSID